MVRLCHTQTLAIVMFRALGAKTDEQDECFTLTFHNSNEFIWQIEPVVYIPTKDKTPSNP